ncbi:RNase adapter RapZ [Polymorphobacter multimanifer]|nr:RNase adapter RapZ [Polymorphobacter multimanifer]
MPTTRQPESQPPSSRLPLLAVSGLSGAGKSTALKALEDLGYEVVDNLPLALVDALIAAPASTDPRPLAFGIDARTRAFDAEALVVRLRALKHTGTDIRLLYLECADDELVRRFSETRRRHPLAIDRPAADAIGLERHLTEPLKRWADLVIDTSDLSVSDLRRRIAEQLGQADRAGLTITLQSFGFAHGLPRNADLVFDMRFLANPHWDMALRPLTGEDARVATHVKADPAYAPAVDRIADLLATLIPGYGREGKAYLTIAIGCTGGRHRSVTVARDLQARLAALGHATTLDHRDMKQAGADAADLAAEPFTTPGADESLTAPPAPVQRAGQ